MFREITTVDFEMHMNDLRDQICVRCMGPRRSSLLLRQVT